MTKDEFANQLRQLGYDVENDKGCVVVVSPYKAHFDELRKIAELVKYDGSFGWRKGS